MAGTGGKRKGAGRKPLAVELRTKDYLDKNLGEEKKLKLVNRLFEMAMQEYRYAELLMAYWFGRPTEKMEVNNTGLPENYTPVVNVITTREKHEKLLQDKADTGYAEVVEVQSKTGGTLKELLQAKVQSMANDRKDEKTGKEGPKK